LILMDLGLPLMDGLAVTRAIREVAELCDVPIVAVTAYHVPGIEEAAREAGCNAYITKPIEFDELDGVIGRLLLGW
jgi:CheY-like chemotaxis protein